jgi:hypothetical protein
MKESHDSKADQLVHQRRLLWAASAGTLDDLECPLCHQRSESAWFTHPGDGIYRTWFICTECSFQLRAQNSGRPEHYSEDRVSEQLENSDEGLLESARFKRPIDKT